MTFALLALAASSVFAQVPADVVVVAGDSDLVEGWHTSGVPWGSGPLVSSLRPNGAVFTDVLVDGLGDVYATFDGSLDVFEHDPILGYQTVATIPGLALTHDVVGVETMWDDHLMVAEATTRGLYEVDPVAGTATLLATMDPLDPLNVSDRIVAFQLIGGRAYTVVGAPGEYAVSVYDFHFDTQTQYTSLPSEPRAMYVLQRPQPTWYLAMPGSPDDVLDVYRGNALRSSQPLSGVTVAMTQAWDGSLWSLYDDGTVWQINAQEGVEADVSALVATGLPVGAAALFSGTANATDACRNNPYKFTSGSCGCDYVDVPVAGGMACRHYSASVGTGVVMSDGVVLDNGSSVGDGASLGERVRVSALATVGAGAVIGDDTLIGRRATIGAGVTMGTDVVVGREATVGAGTVGDMVSIGYGAEVADGTLVAGTVIGSLASLTGGAWSMGMSGSGAPPVVSRSVSLTGGGSIERGVVVGPEVTSVGSLALGSGSRIRKQVTFGTGDVIGESVRIGRSVVVGDAVEVGSDSRVGSRATLAANQCLPVSTVVGVAEFVSGQACP